LSRTMEATIRIGVLVLLVAWCFEIVQPFVVSIAWGVIIAVAAQPAYTGIEAQLGDRSGLAAVVFTVLALAVLIVPTIILAGTVVESSRLLAEHLESGSLSVSPPPDAVLEWPVIGAPLYRIWQLASVNLGAALAEIGPHLKVLGGWLLDAGLGASLGILQFIVAIVIAGVLLAHAEAAGEVARAIAVRLSGERGVEFTEMSETTVRSVARGILGVALIQSLLAGLGFYVAGVPAAGLWALLCLFLAVIQIGPALVLVPMVIYVFSISDTVPATLFMIWSILVGVIDNVLRPILLGRGVKVPMVIVFIGAIGGFITSGIIGLFIGAVILSLGYELFVAWLRPHRSQAQGSGEPRKGAEAE